MADERLYERMIKKAFRLAKKGEGYTSPNPLVGAVIFKGEKIIATGYHRKAGEPHAEANALQKAGSNARGASLAVNLEPCCHVGRTPPCTEAIIRAGIKKVIYSIKDPFSSVGGRGIRILTENGIKAVGGVFEKEARELNEVYLKYIITGRPFVVLKTAQTLDGRIATGSGDSKWISCEESLAFAHKLRARYDAVAIGSGTARADNPSLNVRYATGDDPMRIVITSSDNLSPQLNLFSDSHFKNSVVATTREVISKGVYRKVMTWPVRKGKNGLDLENFLERAAKHEIASILFEGGGRLGTSLIKQRLVDKYYLVIAPIIVGKGIDTIGDLGIGNISQAIKFDKTGFRKIGTDILFWGYPRSR